MGVLRGVRGVVVVDGVLEGRDPETSVTRKVDLTRGVKVLGQVGSLVGEVLRKGLVKEGLY